MGLGGGRRLDGAVRRPDGTRRRRRGGRWFLAPRRRRSRADDGPRHRGALDRAPRPDRLRRRGGGAVVHPPLPRPRPAPGPARRRLRLAPRRARRGSGAGGLPPRRLERDVEGEHGRLRAVDAYPALPARPRLGGRRCQRPDGRVRMRLAGPRTPGSRWSNRLGPCPSTAVAGLPVPSAPLRWRRRVSPVPRSAWSAPAVTTGIPCRCGSTSGSASSRDRARSRWCAPPVRLVTPGWRIAHCHPRALNAARHRWHGAARGGPVALRPVALDDKH